MSSRFRIKSGDIEVEFEGSPEEVSSRFKETFDWLKAVPVAQPDKKQNGKAVANPPSKEKQVKADGRGGVRSPVVSQGVDEMVKSGFFATQKTADQAFDEMKRLNISVADAHTVEMALKRRVPKAMDRTKNAEGKWVYRKKT